MLEITSQKSHQIPAQKSHSSDISLITSGEDTSLYKEDTVTLPSSGPTSSSSNSGYDTEAAEEEIKAMKVKRRGKNYIQKQRKKRLLLRR
jgi:hypothetical protein